jgi:hypothetical protein
MSELPRIEALEARVGYLEREVDGEKRVTRHILEQTRQNSDDLAVLIGRADRLDRKFDKLESKVDKLDSKVDGLDRKLDAFVREFPRSVAEVMREVLREPRG